MNDPRWSSLLLALLVFALSAAAHAQSTYRLTRIGDEFNCTPAAGCFLTVSDINENGEMVGAVLSETEPSRAILLRNGMVIELGDLAGGAARASATAINDLTQITGSNDIFDESLNVLSRAFLWEGGQIRDLGIPNVRSRDINNRGQIVGFTAGDDGVTRPFLWEAGRTTLLEGLPCPRAPGAAAEQINNNGVVVGSSQSFAGTRAVVWQNGEVMALVPPVPMEVGAALDVNDQGDVIGVYSDASGTGTRSFLWQALGVTELLPLELPGANAARVASINNLGQIVGSTHLGPLGSGGSIATLWQEGVARDLNELISDDDPAKPFVTLAGGNRINDAGLIIANGRDSREPDVVFAHYLLTPTGTPASSAATPPPAASSPPPSDNGGGAVDLVSLLLLVIVMSASAACVRRRQRAAARPFD